MIRLFGLAVLLAWAFTSTYLGLAIEYMVGRSGEHLMSHADVLVRMFVSFLGMGRDSVNVVVGMRHLTFIQIVSTILTQLAASMLPTRYQLSDSDGLVRDAYKDGMSATFFYLFIFRYLRLIVHILSFDLLYQSTSLPRTPNIQRGDCTVLLPLEDPENPYFAECLQSCLVNEPAMIVIVPVGEEHAAGIKRTVARYQQQYPHTKITVKAANDANRRHQIAHGLRYVTSKITILMDEYAIWPSARFLPTLLAPFEDRRVGIVGTNKRARRTDNYFWNTLAALNLERQDFEDRAANAIDGGVSAVSSLTSAHRTRILTEDPFIEEFTNEKFFFKTFGPLSTDADSFITRWTLQEGYSAKIQSSDDACIETVLPPKFLLQCLDTARTSWRTSFASLFPVGPPLYRYPWSFYALTLSSFVNLALLYDGVLIYTLSMSPMSEELNALSHLIRWMLVSKIVEFIPYFVQNPQDLAILPASIIFGYIHSFIKIYAGLTFFVTTIDPNTRRIYPQSSFPSSSSSPAMQYNSSPPQGPSRARARSRIRGDGYQESQRYVVNDGYEMPETPARGRGRPRAAPSPIMPSIEEDVYGSASGSAVKKQGTGKPRGRPKKR